MSKDLTPSTSTAFSDHGKLADAIGAQIREYRKKLKMTVADVARQSDLSPGMLSKIERGITSPSLNTLAAVANALNVPVTAFFRKYEEQRDCTYVKSGQGLEIERHGTRAGHLYHLLGHNIGGRVSTEPYLITLSDESEVFPLFQHQGVEFIYLLEGEVVYRHANKTYHLLPGDSLFFDADAPHGPEELVKLPIRLISVHSKAMSEE
ncbi:MAG: helix-turn-helix transcriptional regulator [Gammaproteobacteria bacterium]|jgi:transcriptional regulator with XRE-family HTH domain|nr:helix-turn-helix transcriptional regulator [Gammaproteobacteria bacterium]